MTEADPSNSLRHNARCVIWRHPEDEVPQELRRALQQRGLWFTICDSGYLATAEVCRLTDRDAELPVVLLLMTPGRLDGAEEVLGAVEQYAPHATHWIYDGDLDPKIQAIFHTSAEEGEGSLPPSFFEEEDKRARSDNQEHRREDRQESPSILSGDELASLKRPDQASDSEK